METLLLTEKAAPVLLLTDQRPKKTIKRVEIKVPAGHKLRLDGEVINPFKLIVEAGVRWHPDWNEPRVTVNGWRVFPMGDALGWSGMDLMQDFNILLPVEALGLAVYHGKAIDEHIAGALEQFGIGVPTERQPLSSFILPEQYGQSRH